jgi:hypothetical protein
VKEDLVEGEFPGGIELEGRSIRMIMNAWHCIKSVTLDKAIAGQAGQSEGCDGQQDDRSGQRDPR